jgi:hypothetical protein
MTRTVPAGRYVLEVGAPPGTLISLAARPKEWDPKPLARALKREERSRPKAAAATLDEVIPEAAEVTAKAEKAVQLFNAVAQHQVLEPESLSGEIDALLDLAERLDRHRRFEDAVRLGRALSGLLALTMRWLALARSLRIALRAAQEAGDELAAAWAKHELGTLHLAAEDAAAAERLLGEARDLRRRLGDSRGLAATDRNLQVLCQHLRQLLRDGRLVETGRLLGRVWRYKAVLAIAVAMLLIAGVASAVVDGGADIEACADSTDNDGDGLVDRRDPGCASAADDDESNAAPTTEPPRTEPPATEPPTTEPPTTEPPANEPPTTEPPTTEPPTTEPPTTEPPTTEPPTTNGSGID